MASLDRRSSSWRICSFSATRKHPLLWAHYADSYQGICIEFDASAVSDFGSALPVQYVEEPPKRHWFRATGLENISSMTTKQSAWSYEQEYRLLARERTNRGRALGLRASSLGFGPVA